MAVIGTPRILSLLPVQFFCLHLYLCDIPIVQSNEAHHILSINYFILIPALILCTPLLNTSTACILTKNGTPMHYYRAHSKPLPRQTHLLPSRLVRRTYSSSELVEHSDQSERYDFGVIAGRGGEGVIDNKSFISVTAFTAEQFRFRRAMMLSHQFT